MVREYKKSELGTVPKEWDVLPFKEVFRILSNNTLARDQLNYDSGPAKDIHYGDVLILYPEVLNCAREDIPYINESALLSGQPLQDGDVVIADTAEDETVGKATEIINKGNISVVAGLHTIPCRVKKGKFYPGWLGYYINSHFYHDQLIPYIHGTKVSSIDRESLNETYILIPPYEQQQRIVDALEDIAKLINSSKELTDKSRDLKKGCLQRMFPKKGQVEPDMRLPGFTGPWEQRKVGELTNVLSASRVHKEEWVEEGVPFFRSSDVVSAFKGTENEKAFISYELYEQLAKSSGKLEKEDILITGGGSIGIPYIVPDNKPLYSKDADLIWIKHSDNFDSRYLYTYFTSEEFKDYLGSISHTGTIAHYTIEQVKDTPIKLPSFDEQKAIGQFFSKFDQLITLHQREYEKYQMIKQGMIEDLISGQTEIR